MSSHSSKPTLQQIQHRIWLSRQIKWSLRFQNLHSLSVQNQAASWIGNIAVLKAERWLTIARKNREIDQFRWVRSKTTSSSPETTKNKLIGCISSRSGRRGFKLRGRRLTGLKALPHFLKIAIRLRLYRGNFEKSRRQLKLLMASRPRSKETKVVL